jgi:outer membrane protein TolC
MNWRPPTAPTLPRVNAYAAYGSNSRTLDPSSYKDNTSIGINAEYDLFAGGAIQARIEGAERRVVEASPGTENPARYRERSPPSLFHLEQALERVKVAEAGAASAEEALRLVNEQYHGGTATVTRYLEAETGSRFRVAARHCRPLRGPGGPEPSYNKLPGHWR